MSVNKRIWHSYVAPLFIADFKRWGRKNNFPFEIDVIYIPTYGGEMIIRFSGETTQEHCNSLRLSLLSFVGEMLEQFNLNVAVDFIPFPIQEMVLYITPDRGKKVCLNILKGLCLLKDIRPSLDVIHYSK